MQLGAFLAVAENRAPFADVPYSLLDLKAVEHIVPPLKALTDALDDARGNARRETAYARALEAARGGRPSDPKDPGDPSLIDVLTMCDGLAKLDAPAAGPASALATVVRDDVVHWHHTMGERYQGTSLFYRPVKPHDVKDSYILPADPDDEAQDAAYYKALALCEAAGWDRVALNPLAV
jgi:hypothetical protein